MLTVTCRPVHRQTLGRWQIARKLEIEREFACLRRERADLGLQLAEVTAAKAAELAAVLALTAGWGRCQPCRRWTTVTVGVDGWWRCRTCREYRGMR